MFSCYQYWIIQIDFSVTEQAGTLWPGYEVTTKNMGVIYKWQLHAKHNCFNGIRFITSIHCLGMSTGWQGTESTPNSCIEWVPNPWELPAITIVCPSSLNWLVWACSPMDDCEHANWQWYINLVQAPVQPSWESPRNVWSGWARPSVGCWWCKLWEIGGIDEWELSKTAGILRRAICLPNPN